jgi:hypothetical protein
MSEPNRATASFASILPGALWGGLIGATVDLCFATSLAVSKGRAALFIPQVIASGILGKAAFDGGASSAALGVFAHYFIVLVAAVMFGAASLRMPALVRKPWLFGPLFGLAIFATMRLVVVPLSNAAPFPMVFSLVLVMDGLVHMFGIGLPIALCARRFGARH